MYFYFLIWLSLVLVNVFSTYKLYLNKIFYSLFLIFLVLFIGFRYEIGGDWDNYLAIYEYYAHLDFYEALFFMDPGYSILNIWGNYLGEKEIWFVNFTSALIVGVFLYLTFIKLNKYWLCLLIYFPYHILVVSLGYTRQSIAIAIILYALIKLVEKKNFSFIIFVILAFLFHKTAIIFLLFIFLTFKAFNKKIIYLIKFLSIIVISLLLYLSSISNDNVYTNSEELVSSSGVYMRLSMHIIPLFLYFYYRNLFFLDKHIRLISDYFVLLILYCSLVSLFFSTLADRFNLYLIFFDLFIIVVVYSNVKNKLSLIYSLVVFYTAFISIWMFNSSFVKEAWTPYQNYILNYLLDNVF